MISITDLPTVNVSLNAMSGVLLLLGYAFIRRKKILPHQLCMLGATFMSTFFLISYVTYHYYAGSRPFTGVGPVRLLYFAVLISHVILAALAPPLVAVTLYRAFRGQIGRHRSIARLTLPLWLYISLTGVIVYWMLYRLYAD